MINLDQTYCVSPDCKNECGRKMTEEQKKELREIDGACVSYGYFCGQPAIKFYAGNEVQMTIYLINSDKTHE
jgi:hypothetical protein